VIVVEDAVFVKEVVEVVIVEDVAVDDEVVVLAGV
jgi:hypothetical protein